jgi:hypothetical protein
MASTTPRTIDSLERATSMVTRAPGKRATSGATSGVDSSTLPTRSSMRRIRMERGSATGARRGASARSRWSSSTTSGRSIRRTRPATALG